MPQFCSFSPESEVMRFVLRVKALAVMKILVDQNFSLRWLTHDFLNVEDLCLSD